MYFATLLVRHAAMGQLAMASAATQLLWNAELCCVAQNSNRHGYSIGKVLIATVNALQSYFCLNNYNG